jgi:hypothetical protein
MGHSTVCSALSDNSKTGREEKCFEEEALPAPGRLSPDEIEPDGIGAGLGLPGNHHDSPFAILS